MGGIIPELHGNYQRCHPEETRFLEAIGTSVPRHRNRDSPMSVSIPVLHYRHY